MFQPSIHGWPFGNTYACTGSELGLGGPPPPQLGLGGGLCWTALDRYLRGTAIDAETAAPDPGDPLHTELVQRQVAALAGVWTRVRDWQSAPAGSWRDMLPVPLPLGGADVASRTRAEWRGIRRRLARGEPVLLTILGENDGYDGVRSVRQVLATGWSRQGSRVAVSIYDPDRPGDDDVRLMFGLTGRLDGRVPGADVRGFFAVPYDRTPLATVRTESFDDRFVIGLNRTVRGRVSPASGRKHLDLVARNDRGALLHFRRRNGQHWQGANVTEAEGLSAHELHSDPNALYQAGALHVFARNYVGDLLHFRHRRSWAVTNCTEQKGTGARFRLLGRPVPVAGGGLRLSVLGRDPDGGLVHYRSAPLRGWRAEQVPGDPVAADPVAALDDDTLHVVATAPDGRVLHWARRGDWSITDPETGAGPTIRIGGTPQPVVRDGTLHVLGRDRNDQLAILTLGDDGEWRRVLLAGDLTGEPRAVRGPAGLHVFAPTRGGLVHARPTDDGWDWEDVIGTRPSLEAGAAGAEEVRCWGSGTALRVFVRKGSTLRALSWSPDGDWVDDPVTDRAAASPAMVADHGGRPHLVTRDRLGTVVHVETGPWQEPGAVPERREAPAEASEPTAAEAIEAAATAVPAPGPEQEAEADEPVHAAPEPGPADTPLGGDEPLEPAPDPQAADVAADEGEALDDEVVMVEPPALDFEAEQRMAEPARVEDEPVEDEPDVEPAVAEAIEPDPAEPEPAEAGPVEPGPAAVVAEVEETGEDEPGEEPAPAPVPDTGLELRDESEPAAADAESEPAAAARSNGKAFRWDKDDDKPAGMPEDMEPMDLSLLDTWPPSHTRRRRSRRRSPDDGESDAGESSS